MRRLTWRNGEAFRLRGPGRCRERGSAHCRQAHPGQQILRQVLLAIGLEWQAIGRLDFPLSGHRFVGHAPEARFLGSGKRQREQVLAFLQRPGTRELEVRLAVILLDLAQNACRWRRRRVGQCCAGRGERIAVRMAAAGGVERGGERLAVRR